MLAIVGLPAHIDHAGLLALLDHAQLALQLEHGELRGMPRQLEGAAGPGVDRGHEQVDCAARHRAVLRLADPAVQRGVEVGVREGVGAVLAGGQQELLALEGRRHVHLRDRDPLGARHIAAHAEEARPGQRLRMPCDEGAHDRDVVRPCLDEQLGVLDRLAEHHARLQDLGLARGRRLHAHAVDRGIARAAGRAFGILELDQHVRFVHARPEERVARAQHQHRGGDRGDQPSVVQHQVDVFLEPRVRALGFRAVRCGKRGVPTRIHGLHLLCRVRAGALRRPTCCGRCHARG
ncbi:hypothetical protein D9M68_503480 [compost metagenome]